MINNSKDLIHEEGGRYYLDPFAFLKHKFHLEINPDIMTPDDIDEEVLESVIKQNIAKFEYDTRNYGKYKYLMEKFKEYKDKNKGTEES